MEINLTGHWKGKYKYGKGYPSSFFGKSEPFEFEIVEKNGVITGTCNDEIVKAQNGNESTIEGIFKDKLIEFIKKYKYPSYITDPNSEVVLESIQSDGIHYTGKLYKKILSRTPYFSGKWKITTRFKDKDNKNYENTGEGTWTMSKIT